MLAWAAGLLSLERVYYVGVWRSPRSFVRWSERVWPGDTHAPTVVLAHTCVLFKLLQAGVFLAWCVVHGAGAIWPTPGGPGWWLAGGLLVAAGQTLNLSVFQRLGRDGVFYGNRFGQQLPWHDGFPFSLMAHPQYVGVVLSIWGVFAMLRAPSPDWYVVPAIETVYYAVGARWEQ